MRRLTLLLVGLLAVAGVVATGCGGSGSESATTSAATRQNAAQIGTRRWGITDLGTLGGDDSSASDINDHGQVVGFSYVKAKDAIGNQKYHAFLWENGKMRDLGTLGGEDSEATAVNNRGQVVGWADTTKKGRIGEQVKHAFLWESGKMHDLGTFGGPASAASDINDRGDIVGWADTRAEDPYSYAARSNAHHACLWQRGRIVDLGVFGGLNSEANAINERGEIVGWAETTAKVKEWGFVGLRQHGFLWRNGEMRDLGTLYGRRSEASDVNEHGQIVGSLDTGRRDSETKYGDEPIWHAFVRQNERIRDLTPGGMYSAAHAISGGGEIVGSITPLGENEDSGAVLWTNGNRVDLGTLAYGSEAAGINIDRQVVGWSESRTWDKHAVLWTVKR